MNSVEQWQLFMPSLIVWDFVSKNHKLAQFHFLCSSTTPNLEGSLIFSKHSYRAIHYSQLSHLIVSCQLPGIYFVNFVKSMWLLASSSFRLTVRSHVSAWWWFQHLDDNPPKTKNPGELIAYYKIASEFLIWYLPANEIYLLFVSSLDDGNSRFASNVLFLISFPGWLILLLTGHYKWALTQLFNKRGFRRVIILEGRWLYAFEHCLIEKTVIITMILKYFRYDLTYSHFTVNTKNLEWSDRLGQNPEIKPEISTLGPESKKTQKIVAPMWREFWRWFLGPSPQGWMPLFW